MNRQVPLNSSFNATTTAAADVLKDRQLAGMIPTPLQCYLSQEEMFALDWIDANGKPAHPEMLKTPQQGAATQVWAATSPQLNGLGGLYCEDCDVARRNDNQGFSFSGVKSHAVDPEQAQRLWKLSAQLAGVDAFGKI